MDEVTVTRSAPRGMISLRGDLDSKALQAVCTEVTGVAFPAQGKITMDGASGIAWMSPDEVLLLVPHDKVAGGLATLDKVLKNEHHLASNVSDARAIFTLSGSFAAEVIAKLAPVDLHPDTLKPGDIRRTRLGQVAAAFWTQEDGTFTVVCFRSVADSTHQLLTASAKAGPVGHFA